MGPGHEGSTGSTQSMRMGTCGSVPMGFSSQEDSFLHMKINAGSKEERAMGLSLQGVFKKVEGIGIRI